MIRVYIFYIKHLVEAGGETRGMRREYAPVLYFSLLIFFHFLVIFIPLFSIFLYSSLSISVLHTNLLYIYIYIYSVFILRDTTIRKAILKVFTLGYKIRQNTKSRHILSRLCDKYLS